MKMTLLIWLVAVTLFFYKPNLVMGKDIVCKENEYIVDRNGSKSCLQCNSCGEGLGLSPPCGSILNHPPPIDCFLCEPNKTFSDDFGPSSCKNCHLCSINEIVAKPCTLISDRECSGTCKPGFYYENATHGCLPCSYCCGDDSDIRIPVCKSMGSKQCSFLNSAKCGPTTTLSTASTTTIVSTNRTNDGSKGIGIGKITAIAGGIIGAVILFIIPICCYRRNKMRGNNCANNKNVENGGEPLLHQCGLSQIQFGLQIANYNGPETQAKLVIEGGQLLLKLTYENDNDNECYRNCMFKWKQDGSELKYKEGKELEINNLEISNSGKFQCHLHCEAHQQDKDSVEMVIHVQPKPGYELKLLLDISFPRKQRIGLLLNHKTPDVGNWRDVGDHYGMNREILDDLKGKDTRGEEVIDYLNSRSPDLTVFDFCEFLKAIKQFRIVDVLSSELTVEKNVEVERDTSMNDTRDSGIDFEDQSPPQVKFQEGTCTEYLEDPCSLRVKLPPESSSLPEHHMQKLNTSYSDSSREGSIDELNRQPCVNVKDASINIKKKRKPSFVRQVSKEFTKRADTKDIDSGMQLTPDHPSVPLLKGINVNLCYSDSSREGSIDDLDRLPKVFSKSISENSNGASANVRKKKKSLDRQVSKESQNSAGNMSMKIIKDAVMKTLRQGNGNLENEDTEDSEA